MSEFLSADTILQTMTEKDFKNQAKELHVEIERALTVIQESIIQAKFSLFPAVCAMMTIIHSYRNENAGAKEVLQAYETVLNRITDSTNKPKKDEIVH